MTCLEAQSLVTPYINDELDLKVCEEFLRHVNSCAECREELEVYYTLLTVMKQLDEDKNLSENFKQELEIKLSSTEEKIIRKKVMRTRKRILLFLLVLLCCVGINLKYSYIIRKNHVEVSEYKLRKNFFFDSKEEELEKSLQIYIDTKRAKQRVDLWNKTNGKEENSLIEDGINLDEENYIN